MADWDIAWKPQQMQPYEYGSKHRTLISEFESGGEQRRRKWSRARHPFVLNFTAITEATVHAIRVFFDARGGAYEAFNFPNYGQKISGTRLALVDGGAGLDTITDSSGGFLAIGYDSNLQVCVNGSATPANDKHYSLTTVAAGTLSIPTASLTAADSANAALEVYTSYRVRFKEDQFMNGFVRAGYGAPRTIELIEVI